MKIKHVCVTLLGLIFSTISWANPIVDAGSKVDQVKGEDRVMVHMNFDNATEQHLFGVFDGHMSDAAAEYVEKKFPLYFVDENFRDNPGQSIQYAFEILENELAKVTGMRGTLFMPKGVSGTTATIAFLRDGEMLIAHLGDSRAVLSRNGRALQLTTDHIPNDPKNPTSETKRVLKAGNPIVYYYVSVKPKDLWWIGGEGVYPLTRSLGAHDKKEKFKGIISIPEIKSYKITSDDEFLILGTDGLWDFAPSNQYIIDKAKELFNQGKKPKQVAEEIARHIRDDQKGADDIGIVVVKFTHE